MLSPHLRCSTCAEPLRTSMVPQVLSALEVAKGGAGAQQAGVEIHEEDGMAIRMVEGAHSMSIQSSELRAHRAQSRDACLACHTSASHSPTATRRALWARHGPHRVAPKLRVVRTQRPDPLTLCLPLCPVASVNSILHTLPRRHATRLCNAQAVPVRGLDLQLCNAGYRPRAPRLTPRLREGSRPCPQPTLAVPSLTCRPGR